MEDLLRQEITQRAKTAGVELTAEHWYFIELIWDYYQKHHTVLTLRYLVRKMGMDKKKIYALFGSSPIKFICQLTKLPVPPEC
jgi:tRNA 2-thiouridine synthesizing protein E